MATKRQSLGKGLDALLGMADNTDFDAPDSAQPAIADGELKQLPVDLLQRGKYQPRRDIHPDALEELATLYSNARRDATTCRSTD